MQSSILRIFRPKRLVRWELHQLKTVLLAVVIFFVKIVLLVEPPVITAYTAQCKETIIILTMADNLQLIESLLGHLHRIFSNNARSNNN